MGTDHRILEALQMISYNTTRSLKVQEEIRDSLNKLLESPEILAKAIMNAELN